MWRSRGGGVLSVSLFVAAVSSVLLAVIVALGIKALDRPGGIGSTAGAQNDSAEVIVPDAAHHALKAHHRVKPHPTHTVSPVTVIGNSSSLGTATSGASASATAPAAKPPSRATTSSSSTRTTAPSPAPSPTPTHPGRGHHKH